MGNQISRNFYLSEFSCKCGCGIPFKVDAGLVAILQAVRTNIDRKCYISSGARCREHNASVGGARRSWHVPKEGILYAADVQVMDPCSRDELSALHLYVLADKNGAHGLGLYPRWVHIDSRKLGIMKGQDRQRWISEDFNYPSDLRMPKN